jgi:hypothetical protein
VKTFVNLAVIAAAQLATVIGEPPVSALRDPSRERYPE